MVRYFIQTHTHLDLVIQIVIYSLIAEQDKRKTHTTGEDEKRSERGWNLLAQFFGLLGTAKDRVVGRVRHRLESTSNVADAVFKEAKKAVVCQKRCIKY